MDNQRQKRRRVLRQQNSDDIDFNRPISQEEFGKLIQWTQQDVSKLCRFNVLSPGGTLQDWSREFFRFQLGIIYARHGWQGLARANGD